MMLSDRSYLMPAEYAEHSATVVCWPARREIYGDHFAEAEEAHALVANTVARFEPVIMVVDPAYVARAQELCGHGVEIVEMPIDDSWARDSGPIYVFDAAGNRVAMDFIFNGWGQKFTPFNKDAELARAVAAHLDDPVESIPVVLEGGSINVDGTGTLITTEQCLLHPNRNPSMSPQQIERTLFETLGASHVVWLPYGLALDDDTDGHVDNVAAFTRPGHVLLQGCEDTSEEDFARMTANEDVARRSIAANGRPLEVDVIPVLPFVDTPNGRAVVPYLNFYVGNDFVLIPVCGHPADDDMVQLIGEYFPGREMVPLNVGRILAIGGGGIHCITQQVPMLGIA